MNLIFILGANGIRDERTKELFIAYLLSNPNQRFWQAVRNFSPFAYICGTEDPPWEKRTIFDTFYIEADNDPEYSEFGYGRRQASIQRDEDLAPFPHKVSS